MTAKELIEETMAQSCYAIKVATERLRHRVYADVIGEDRVLCLGFSIDETEFCNIVTVVPDDISDIDLVGYAEDIRTSVYEQAMMCFGCYGMGTLINTARSTNKTFIYYTTIHKEGDTEDGDLGLDNLSLN